MSRTYWWQTPAGCLSIRQFEKGPWRLWAGDEFIRSFPTPEAALQALADRSVKLPSGRWIAPLNLEDWRFAAGKLPPTFS